MAKSFFPYTLDQQILLPQDMREWLPENHLAYFILDLVDSLDLDAIVAVYRAKDGRGRAPYHPKMMVSLLLYAYCMGKPSSRKIERATYEDVAYRVISGDQHPDHDTISDFRRQHLKALSGLFVQVLLLCQQAGLIKLGHVALDGTKVKANASKHKAMSYKRMCETEEKLEKLEKEVETLLQEAQQVDEDEDAKYGKGRRADEIPGDLARRESRLKKIKEAKAALEEAAKEKAAAKAKEARAKLAERERKEQETGKKTGGRPPQVPNPDEAVPEPKSQRNFTDPESRFMKDGASKSFEQAYNTQAAVDATAQIIVASSVTQQSNDKQQLVPMLNKVKEQMGRMPEQASANSGYFSEAAMTDDGLSEVDLFVPPERKKRKTPDELTDEELQNETSAGKMREKLNTDAGREVYAQRKHIVEPVFGQTKEARGFRRFSFRGLAKVSGEWDLICLTHNLLKLFRSGFSMQAA